MTAAHLRAGVRLISLVAPLARLACTERSGFACSESEWPSSTVATTAASGPEPNADCRAVGCRGSTGQGLRWPQASLWTPTGHDADKQKSTVGPAGAVLLNYHLSQL